MAVRHRSRTDENPAKFCFLAAVDFLFSDCLPRRLSENREPTTEKRFWPISPIKFIKYNKYSPHLIKKLDSKPLSLATASILGQPPRPNIVTVQHPVCPAPS